MPKIAIADLLDEQRWSLQGQLVGQRSDELRSTWREAHHAGDTRRCLIDLIEVTSIDRNGETVLAEIMSQSAKLISGDAYTSSAKPAQRVEAKPHERETEWVIVDDEDVSPRPFCLCGSASRERSLVKQDCLLAPM